MITNEGTLHQLAPFDATRTEDDVDMDKAAPKPTRSRRSKSAGRRKETSKNPSQASKKP